MRKFIWAIVFLIATVFVPAISFCGEIMDEESIFAQANSLYEKGEYAQAIREYQKILDTNRESSSVYYNMANAYFKSGDLGRAILNYRRALVIDPRDADIVANYKFAQATIKETVIPKRGIWAWRPLRIYAMIFTVNEIMLISSLLYVIVLIFLFIAVRFPYFMRYAALAAISVSIFLLFNTVVTGYKIGSIGSQAVVISKQAPVLFGPFESATKFFTLNEGMNVRVIKKKDEWYKVRRVDGKVGWVKMNEVEIV